jgi:glutamate/aspartate transport system substrate-binding protein
MTSAVLIVAAASAMAAPPAPAASRLERIRQTGTLILAYRENAMPFSYLHQGQPMGLGVDISKAVAEDLRRYLGLPRLDIRWNPVSPVTRLPLMTSGAIDLECAMTTHTKEREGLASFSHTFYVTQEGVATRAAGSSADQTGKTAALEGSATLRRLRAGHAGVLPVRNVRAGLRAVSQGQADAFVARLPLLAGERLQLGRAGQAIVLNAAADSPSEALACLLPPGDTAFVARVNSTLERLMRDGEMARLHDRWLTQPIEPGGASLNLPMNPATREAYEHPGS